VAEAPLLSIHSEHPQPRALERCLAILEAGGLIAYPTDTCYAVGCDVTSKKALERLFGLERQKDRKKPVSLVCADLSDVARYGHVSNFAYRTMRHLTPGPFTFVLEATRLVPQLMSNKQKEVGIRVPDAPIPRALAQGLGRPLANTSARDPEGELLVDPRDIKSALGHGLDLILDAGVLAAEQSTVVSLMNDSLEVLRQGKGQLDLD
jgi:tRNA threonylcarbamoyl adenosine modification protein (Sua5/YciO/YrdC/YwlC family)